MKTALDKAKTLSPLQVPYSQAAFQKLRYFLPDFEQAIIYQKEALANQVRNNKAYTNLVKKAKLYISHFIQVLNFAIARGEISPNVREFYGFEENDKKVPSLTTEAELINWGEKIIKGEAQRLMQRGNPLTNPTIAVVKVNYEKFLSANRSQKIFQATNTRMTEKVASLRSQADEIILNIWNDAEATYIELPDEERREKTSEYGVIYVYRKTEKGYTGKLDPDEDVKKIRREDQTVNTDTWLLFDL